MRHFFIVAKVKCVLEDLVVMQKNLRFVIMRWPNREDDALSQKNKEQFCVFVRGITSNG